MCKYRGRSHNRCRYLCQQCGSAGDAGRIVRVSEIACLHLVRAGCPYRDAACRCSSCLGESRKKATAPEAPPAPPIGDKVTIPSARSVLEVTHVSHDGDEVNLQLPGTNLQWFKMRTDTVTFVDRKPPARTSNPFTDPEPDFDTDEILERRRGQRGESETAR